MSDRQRFEEKLARRRANPWGETTPEVFWHCACMGNWREVVAEQLGLARHVGLNRMTCCVLGSEDDAAFVKAVAVKLGVTLVFADVQNNLKLYELPTLQRVWEFGRQCSTTIPILYWHTKGVSAPLDRRKALWRRLMQRHVVAGWRQNVKLLAVADIVGVDWQDSPDFPHYSGNFWMARSDWLAWLSSPAEYQALHPASFFLCGQPWKRICAEMWLGSKQWHHVESLGCRNEVLWHGTNVFRHDVSVEEFAYPKLYDERKVNLGSGDFPINGWLNVDVRPGVKPDLVADVMTHEFEAASLDEIYCGHLIEHVSDPLELLRRCRRWLRPDGVLTLTTPNFAWASDLYHRGAQHNGMTGQWIAFGLSQPVEQRHVSAFTPGVLTACLNAAGFRDVRPVPDCPLVVEPVPWQFVFAARPA